jgi:hypothetical protein
MNFRIKYRRRATRALASIWLTAPDRDAITRITERYERSLAMDPLGHGESRSGNERVLVIEPLAVFYAVYPVKRLVVIRDIRSRSHPS